MPRNQLGFSVPHLLLLFVILAGVGGAGWLVYKRNSEKSDLAHNNTQPSVANFEECKNAGYPVQESYPEKCSTPDGRMFTDVVEIEHETFLSRHGFSLKYPENWTISADGVGHTEHYADLTANDGSYIRLEYTDKGAIPDDDVHTFDGETVKIEMYVTPNFDGSLEAWTDSNLQELSSFGYTDIQVSDQIINGIPAKKITAENGTYKAGTYSVMLVSKNLGFKFVIYSKNTLNPPQEAIDIINSFSF